MSTVVELADLAAEQWGLVTTAQSRKLGVSAQTVARLTNRGVLERMTHGVYRVTGAPPDPADELRAAWLTLDPARRATARRQDQAPSVVSHRSAASLHGLGDLDADKHEFTVAVRKQSRRPDIQLHRGQIQAEEWTLVDGLPVTTVVRTVADLAAARIDGGHLASVVRDALTVKRVSDEELVAALRLHAHHYGARMGDGEGLLARFLQESGVARPLGRAVELASGSSSAVDFATRALAASPQMKRLQEQMASVQDAIALAVTPELQKTLQQLSAVAAEQLLPASPAALSKIRDVNVNALVTESAVRSVQEITKQTDLAQIARTLEQIRKTMATSQFRQFMAEQSKSAK